MLFRSVKAADYTRSYLGAFIDRGDDAAGFRSDGGYQWLFSTGISVCWNPPGDSDVSIDPTDQWQCSVGNRR